MVNSYEEIKPRYEVGDVVYTLYENKIICAKVYAFKIEAVSLFKKQLHNSGYKKLEFSISYKIVCEQTRCNDDEMTNYFYESSLFDSEYECINNIKRIK